MAYPGLAHEDHKYLGKEYCTGYTDVYGKWNTGFYCPQYGSKTAVFCCGTAVFKYCCTNQEPVDLTASGGNGVLLDGDDPNFDGSPHHGVSSAVFVRVPVVFGVVCGIAAVLILLIVAGCYFCSCCFAYKKRRNDVLHTDPHHHLHLNHHPGLSTAGLYRNTNGTNSTASSNVLNLYSPATTGPLANSLVTTPLDLDWASSIASTYQSQQQLYPLSQSLPGIHQFPSGNHSITPATAALAAALSQQQHQRSSSAASSLLYNTATPGGIAGGGNSGAPSVISASLTNSSGVGRLPYQNFINTSTSTLSSSTAGARQNPPVGNQLHRGNLPQQISTTASIVNSYLASLQQAQSQIQNHNPSTETHAPTLSQNGATIPPPLPTITPERTRHPSPPPSYFQSVSSASYQGSGNNRSSTRSNMNYSASSRSGNRMANIQSILGGGPGSNYNSSGNFNWSNEDDLLLADFLLRHENTLRRTLGLANNSNNRTATNNNNNNNNHGSSTTANNNCNNNSNNSRNNRSNPLLSQRELIDLLLRLTCNNNSHLSSASIPRSDSRAGSETNSTASSVATTRSTVSSSSSSNGAPNHPHHHHHLHHTHSKTPSSTSSGIGSTKLTINEVDEDLDELHEVGSSTGTATTTSSLPPRGNSKNALDLTLSRLSVENDSGLASSGCSTAGSEHAEGLMGSIKVITRDLSEEALKLKKQHAVDDDVRDDGGIQIKMCEQQLAATIHPETNCTSVGKSTSPTSPGEVLLMESTTNDQHHHQQRENCTTSTSSDECQNAPTIIQSKAVVTVTIPDVNINGDGVVPVHVVKTGENDSALTSATAQI